MRILWIDPIGTDMFTADVLKILEAAKRDGVQVDGVSLPADRPKHLEYHAYEALVINTFSVLVGRRKWIPKMSENVHLYGHGHRLASMRPLGLGVHDFQVDHQRTCDRLLTEGRKAIQEDGAEVLILGCTAEYGFNKTMQDELGVPVIDAVTAPFKYAEFLAELAGRFGWYPSRAWGGEAPPREEIGAWGLFDQRAPVGTRMSNHPYIS
jgi:allantoin racemase